MNSIIRKKYSIENYRIVEKSNGEYYSKEIANNISEYMYELDNGVENSFPEIMILFEDEINEKREEIEKLKKQDNDMYEKIVTAYNIVAQSEEFKTIITNLQKKGQDNTNVKEELAKANANIKELCAKLEIALNRVEELQNMKMSIWQKISLKISKKRKSICRKNVNIKKILEKIKDRYYQRIRRKEMEYYEL